jgi:hypothetical protein
VREWLHGRFAGHHFHWLTGVPLVAFAFVCAIGASGSTGTRWASTRHGHGRMAGRAAVAGHAAGALSDRACVGDRLFSLFVFVHLGVALLMFLFGLWFHIQRLAHVGAAAARADAGLIGCWRCWRCCGRS